MGTGRKLAKCGKRKMAKCGKSKLAKGGKRKMAQEGIKQGLVTTQLGICDAMAYGWRRGIEERHCMNHSAASWPLIK